MNLIIEQIEKIICEYLKIENIDPKESLYKKGIDSINMILIIDEIEEKFHIKIPDEELLMSNFETIEQISKLVINLGGWKNDLLK